MSDEADDIATNILHHIDSMYPKMWEGVSRDSARTSIRNTITREVAATIEQLTQELAGTKDALSDLENLHLQMIDERDKLQPKADAFDVLKEEVKTLEQTLLEVWHAQECGPGWYTRGESGLWQQVRMWMDKGFASIKTVKAAIQQAEGET